MELGLRTTMARSLPAVVAELRMEDPQKFLGNNFSVVLPHEVRVEQKKYIIKTVNTNLKVP